MLICNNCGKIIEESELSTHKEFISYFGDDKYYETSSDGCPCGGEFEEAVKCDCCGEYYLNSDMLIGWRHNVWMSKNCIDYYKGKYQRIYNQLSFNGEDEFIDWLVDKGEVEER